MIKMEFPRAELERYANDTDRIYALKRQVDMLINNLQIVLDSIEDDINIENATTTIHEDSSYTETDPSVPNVTASDNGKVMRVVNGVWSAVLLPSASGVSF